MEFPAAVVGADVQSVLTRAFNQSLGVKSLSDQIQTLRDKKKELIARVNKVNEILQIAEIHGKTCTKDAQDWWNRAEAIIHVADAVDKEASVAKICTTGIFCTPDCCSRLKLEIYFLKYVEVMDDLLNEASHFSEESLTFLGMEMPTTGLIGSAAHEILKMVWECIVGFEFEKIGVYGMGGVGKTTIMKTISNQLVQQCIRFENVLWVTVSKDVDVQKLQNQIAKRVALDLSAEQDEAIRSSMLLSALRRKGKFVLILDDMWEAFDLQALGVPKPTKDNGCKIILTTRSREVCERMLCQKYVKVEQLSKDEAWELFSVNVDEKLVPNVEEIAKEVVAECCGLPLAIITIGQSMRSKDVGEWRVALSDLKNSTSLNMDMTEQVIQHLKFSYDRLSEENHQKCFLYCALYPEDYKIDTSELIEYWVMEGLVKGSSKEDEMLRGRVILNILKRCCMLEEVSLEGRLDRDLVKMHDLIRDMALYITKSKPKFMVKTGLSSTKVSHEDDWSEDLERVSFMESRIENIPIIPKCPKLLTLIFAQKYYRVGLKYIAPDFFRHMNSLTVLNLSGTRIESLPDSASDLVNLHGLLLSHCEELVRVPSLSKLESLRVLKLTRSAIEELPHGMEMLVNLRCLDLSFNRKLKEMIPSGLISKFSLLQELQLVRMEVMYARERRGDFVQELSSLTHLENLTIKFHELSDFISYAEFTNFEKLKKYVIQMERYQFYRQRSQPQERILCLSNSKGIPCDALRLPKNIQFLTVGDFANSELPFLQRVENMGIAHGAFPCLKKLEIESCDNIKVLFSSRLLQQLLNLEEIIVKNCSQLEELVVADGDESGAIPVLPRLHNLHLQELRKLKSSCNQLFMYSNSWQSVSIHTVKLDRLFISTRLLQHFQYLEYIILSKCAELEELIVEEEEACETVALPRLKVLDFCNLPKLKSIWKGVMVCDSLQRVKVWNCPELKRLPLFNREHQSAPPSLKKIIGSREWWDSLEWGDYPRPEHLFRRLSIYLYYLYIEGSREWWGDYPCPEHLFRLD